MHETSLLVSNHLLQGKLPNLEPDVSRIRPERDGPLGAWWFRWFGRSSSFYFLLNTRVCGAITRS